MDKEKENRPEASGLETYVSVAKPFASPDEFASIVRHRIPPAILAETGDFFRAAGRRRVEGVVLWLGRKQDDYLTIERLVIPQQTVGRCYFEVSLEERIRIALSLTDQELVAVQVHTHEEVAFHSPTDDRKAIVDRQWALSVVVPYFCHGGLAHLQGTAVFALRGPLDWVELTPEQINTLFIYS